MICAPSRERPPIPIKIIPSMNAEQKAMHHLRLGAYSLPVGSSMQRRPAPQREPSVITGRRQRLWWRRFPPMRRRSIFWVPVEEKYYWHRASRRSVQENLAMKPRSDRDVEASRKQRCYRCRHCRRAGAVAIARCWP